MRRCRECGCLDECACQRTMLFVGELQACWWVEDDLCSACMPTAFGWEHPPWEITDRLVAQVA